MATVDDEAVAEIEQEGVTRLVGGPVAGGVVPGDDPAEVLDDLFTGCQVAAGEQTSAVDGRLPNSCASHSGPVPAQVVHQRCASSLRAVSPTDLPDQTPAPMASSAGRPCGRTEPR